MKSHDKGKGNGSADSKPTKPAQPPTSRATEKPSQPKSQPEKPVSFTVGLVSFTG